MGLPLGRQIVVLRLPGGGLWIHSPVPMTLELRRELAALGEVRHVVGPNIWHDEGLREFQAEHPAACFHAAPGLAVQKRDVRFGAELSDAAYPDWVGVLDQHLVRGMPRMNEVVFYHPASCSLILADLAFNLGPDGPWWFALLMRTYGVWNRFAPTPLEKWMMQDKVAVGPHSTVFSNGILTASSSAMGATWRLMPAKYFARPMRFSSKLARPA